MTFWNCLHEPILNLRRHSFHVVPPRFWSQLARRFAWKSLQDKHCLVVRCSSDTMHWTCQGNKNTLQRLVLLALVSLDAWSAVHLCTLQILRIALFSVVGCSSDICTGCTTFHSQLVTPKLFLPFWKERSWYSILKPIIFSGTYRKCGKLLVKDKLLPALKKTF